MIQCIPPVYDFAQKKTSKSFAKECLMETKQFIEITLRTAIK